MRICLLAREGLAKPLSLAFWPNHSIAKELMGKVVSLLSPAVSARHARILIQVGLSITQN
jgi:hypothetical protein